MTEREKDVAAAGRLTSAEIEAWAEDAVDDRELAHTRQTNDSDNERPAARGVHVLCGAGARARGRRYPPRPRLAGDRVMEAHDSAARPDSVPLRPACAQGQAHRPRRICQARDRPRYGRWDDNNAAPVVRRRPPRARVSRLDPDRHQQGRPRRRREVAIPGRSRLPRRPHPARARFGLSPPARRVVAARLLPRHDGRAGVVYGPNGLCAAGLRPRRARVHVLLPPRILFRPDPVEDVHVHGQ